MRVTVGAGVLVGNGVAVTVRTGVSVIETVTVAADAIGSGVGDIGVSLLHAAATRTTNKITSQVAFILIRTSSQPLPLMAYLIYQTSTQGVRNS